MTYSLSLTRFDQNGTATDPQFWHGLSRNELGEKVAELHDQTLVELEVYGAWSGFAINIEAHKS